jgi:acetylglutamate kinase
MKTIKIVKIGGNAIDNPILLDKFLSDFTVIREPKILIHGGGKIATDFAIKLNIPQTLIEGRRITNSETLDVAIMVYSGLINKNIVSKLQALNCNAMGFCGADGNLVKSKKRIHETIDYGEVGDVEEVNVNQLKQLLDMGIIPVLSAISHDGKGNLLNTNADTMASKIASALSSLYDVDLIYCFEKNGVLLDVNDENSFLSSINKKEYERMKKAKIIFEGMIPKLDNAFEALENGVQNVKICNAQNFSALGTELVESRFIATKNDLHQKSSIKHQKSSIKNQKSNIQHQEKQL